VPGQTDDHGIPKPGTITVVDAGSLSVEREVDGIDPDADGGWNNPHNMWANDALSVVYNANWFGRSLNRINRATGDIVDTIDVGEAPTHIVTNPNESSAEFGFLTNPLSADNDLVTLRDARRRLEVVDSDPTGAGETHPHGHWLTSDGSRVVVPNVFTGLGFGGSVSIMATESGNVIRELTHQSTGLRSALVLPVAAGIRGKDKAYVSNIGSGQVSVIDLAGNRIVRNIPVTFTPDGQRGARFDLFHTLQAPIQVPVSPDGRFAGVAVLSLTNVARPPTGAADHVAIIDTTTDEAVAFLPTPAGTHGAHWGAKLGGGYYLYVTNQNSNAMTVIDPDPDGDGSGANAAVVGRIVLANGSAGAGATDGTGGQGLKPLPNVYDGWVQDTVALAGSGRLSAEVESWVAALTPEQRNPSGAAIVSATPVSTAVGTPAAALTSATATAGLYCQLVAHLA
jgi:YVTN family beta-propeller protein